MPQPEYYCRKLSNTDAYSTAIFVLGPEKGMILARELGMETVIIGNDGKRHLTEAIKEKISFENGT